MTQEKKISRRSVIAAGIGLAAYGASRGLRDFIVSNFSQREFSFIAGVDFEAYDTISEVTGQVIKKGSNVPVKVTEQITNWDQMIVNGRRYWGSTRNKLRLIPELIYWLDGVYANALSYTPYVGLLVANRALPRIQQSDKLQEKREPFMGTPSNVLYLPVAIDYSSNAKKAILSIGDEDIKSLGEKFKLRNLKNKFNRNTLVLKVRSNPEAYKFLISKKNIQDTIYEVAERVGYAAINLELGDIIVEYEVSDKSTGYQHNERIKLLREINNRAPREGFKLAVSLDSAIGFEKEKGLWNIEKVKPYWDSADVVMVNDYLSTKEKLPISIDRFKNAIGNRKLMIRLITGQPRIDAGLKGDEKDLAEMLVTAYNSKVDGIFVNDVNGAWIFNGQSNPFDYGIREKWLKATYQKLFGVYK